MFLGAVFLVEPATPAANLPSAEIAPLTLTSPWKNPEKRVSRRHVLVKVVRGFNKRRLLVRRSFFASMAKSYATHGVPGGDVRVVLVRVGRAPLHSTNGRSWTPASRTLLNTLLFFRHLLITWFGVPLRAIKSGRGHACGGRWSRSRCGGGGGAGAEMTCDHQLDVSRNYADGKNQLVRAFYSGDGAEFFLLLRDADRRNDTVRGIWAFLGQFPEGAPTLLLRLEPYNEANHFWNIS